MWILTIITGVILQGFGRLALARVYVKTERVIHEVQANASAGGGDGGGSSSRAAIRRDSNSGTSAARTENEDTKSFLKLNPLSSSIGEALGGRVYDSYLLVYVLYVVEVWG